MILCQNSWMCARIRESMNMCYNPWIRIHESESVNPGIRESEPECMILCQNSWMCATIRESESVNQNPRIVEMLVHSVQVLGTARLTQSSRSHCLVNWHGRIFRNCWLLLLLLLLLLAGFGLGCARVHLYTPSAPFRTSKGQIYDLSTGLSRLTRLLRQLTRA